MIERNDLYDYGCMIYQNKDYFKFSIDSILLGEFVKYKKSDTILDMCTGNAPVPMILTTKCPDLKIDAVEIQKEVYDLAKQSIEENQMTNITLYNEDIKKVNLESKYDIITCNPPYFKIDEKSQQNENKIKRIARHEVTLKLEDVVNIAHSNLKETGKLYLVHRVERMMDVIDTLKNKSFGIRKICFVFTKANANAEFFLLEASKYKKSDPKVTYINIENLKTYKNIFKEVRP